MTGGDLSRCVFDGGEEFEGEGGRGRRPRMQLDWLDAVRASLVLLQISASALVLGLAPSLVSKRRFGTPPGWPPAAVRKQKILG